MPSLRRPTGAQIAAFAARQADAPFSYDEVGATRSEIPSGYRIDRAALDVGHGEVDFGRAAQALREWRHYDDPRGRIRL